MAEQTNGTPTTTKTQAGGMTKADAARQAFGELGKKAKPLQVQALLREKFNIEMSTKAISNYKTALKNKGKKKQAAATHAARPGAAQQPQAHAVPAPGGRGKAAGGIDLKDILAVKELVRRIGADQLKSLIDILVK